jgi:RNA recognition motif-containing protein
MDSSKTKKKWVSSRLVKKKEELGIEEKPDTSESTKDKKPSKRVKKVSKNNNNKNGSKRGSNRIRKNGSKKSSKFSSNKGQKNNYKRGSKKSSRRRYNGPKHVVRISNLPDNITVNELNYLVSEWGDIGNINIKKYTNYDGTITNCYIDFYNEEEANYFVEALDNTPFDCLIINVKVMDFSSKN